MASQETLGATTTVHVPTRFIGLRCERAASMLLPDSGMSPHLLSRPEMGTIVHLSRVRVLARNVALQHDVGVRIISRVVETGVGKSPFPVNYLGPLPNPHRCVHREVSRRIFPFALAPITAAAAADAEEKL